jgi:hypothetical protein
MDCQSGDPFGKIFRSGRQAIKKDACAVGSRKKAGWIQNSQV